MPSVASARHPSYSKYEDDFTKWRLTMEGGTQYKDEYLQAMTGETNFDERKAISYVPAFAKEAILEISRAIHQRLPRVQRSGGSGTYVSVCKGQKGGVDRRGSTMNSFISRNIIDELCFLGLTGVFIDNIKPAGKVKADLGELDHPYLYAYKREDIMDWAYSVDNPTKLQYVVLRDHIDTFDPATGLRDKETERFRFAYLNKVGTVTIELYSSSGSPLDQNGIEAALPYQFILELPRIPFVLVDIGMPLTTDVADYQIAHMVLASLDMNYAVKSNIPFYVEQRAPFGGDLYAQKYAGLPLDEDGNPVDPQDLTEETRNKYLRDASQIVIGATQGRTYSTNTERPAFINPSPEPLRASMEKQDTIKSEIRELVALSLKQAGLRFQSESSKKLDDRPLEAGLSYIGLVLEAAEIEINAAYAAYEGAIQTTIKYPETYNLMTEAERREAIKEDATLMSGVPSQTFRTEMQKSIIQTKFSHVLDPAIVEKMEQEVEAIAAPTSDPDEIRSDVEAGLLSAEFGSKIRGYPDGEAAKAQEEKAVRLNIATRMQAPAHENPDTLDPQTKKETQKAEKAVVNDTDVNLSKQTRGEGK